MPNLSPEAPAVGAVPAWRAPKPEPIAEPRAWKWLAGGALLVTVPLAPEPAQSQDADPPVERGGHELLQYDRGGVLEVAGSDLFELRLVVGLLHVGRELGVRRLHHYGEPQVIEDLPHAFRPVVAIEQ